MIAKSKKGKESKGFIRIFKSASVSRPDQHGFTLIELLVVISVISLLSSVVLASLQGAREEARYTAAQAQLQAVHTAMQLLMNDTGTWPAGCKPGAYSNSAAALDQPNAGLIRQPTVGSVPGSQNNRCEWTASEVARWNGPYMTAEELTDPWGNPYRFDSNWVDYENCRQEGNIPAIFSGGPDGLFHNGNSCDDVYIRLERQ